MADKVGQHIIETGSCSPSGHSLMEFTTEHWDQQVAQAEAAFKAGDVKRAIGIYEQGIVRGIQSISAFQTLGDLCLFVRDYKEALVSFERAWSIETSAHLLDRIVMALVGMGRVEQAYDRVAAALSDQTVSDIHKTQLAEPVYLVWPCWH